MGFFSSFIKKGKSKTRGKKSKRVESIPTYRDFLVAYGQVCCTDLVASKIADEQYIQRIGLAAVDVDDPEFFSSLSSLVNAQRSRLNEDGYIVSILKEISEHIEKARAFGMREEEIATGAFLNLASIAFARYLMKIHPEFREEAKTLEPVIRHAMGLPERPQSPVEQMPMSNKATELFYAAYGNDLIQVERLLMLGADPDEPSFVNITKEHIFDPDVPQKAGALIMQQFMMKSRHPDTYHHMELGISTLHYPILEGYNGVVHALLEAGADPNIRSFHGMFPLYVAAEMGNLTVVRDLVEHGADVNQVTPKNCTPILNAAEEGNRDVVAYLLSVGADPTIENKFGYDARSAAERYEHIDIAEDIRSFLNSSQSRQAPAAQSFSGDVTSVMAEGLYYGDERLVAKALDRGAKIDQRYEFNRKIMTPIVEAAVQRNYEMTEILLKAGADPNQAQKNGETALGNAAQNGDYMIALALLEAGADPNAVTPVGPVLAIAHNIAMMHLLISHGGSLDLPDRDGDIPIVGPITAGDYQAAYFLKVCGSNLGQRNENGLSPLDIAKLREDERMMSALMNDRYEDPEAQVNIADIRQEMNRRIVMLRSGEYPIQNFMLAGLLQDDEAITDEQNEVENRMLSLAEQALNAKRSGDLPLANELYRAGFESDQVFNTRVLWGWVKVLLLAKSFKDAHLVMKYFSAVSARSNEFCAERSEMNLNSVASSARTFEFDGFTAFSEYTNTYPMDKTEVEEKIRAFGGSDHWNGYSLTTNEYDAFLRYFGIDNVYRAYGIDD